MRCVGRRGAGEVKEINDGGMNELWGIRGGTKA